MAKENVSLIDSELRQKYVDFTDKFVVTEESLSALRSGGGMRYVLYGIYIYIYILLETRMKSS